MSYVIGIDPGNKGAIVVASTSGVVSYYDMPTQKNGKREEVVYEEALEIVEEIKLLLGDDGHLVLEKAAPFKMGATSAFNYGRSFAALEILARTCGLPYTMVHPRTWTKVMWEGISAKGDSKQKSLAAVKRLFPHEYKLLPCNKNGKHKDGPVDALLIAAYGLRKILTR